MGAAILCVGEMVNYPFIRQDIFLSNTKKTHIHINVHPFIVIQWDTETRGTHASKDESLNLSLEWK